MSELILNKNLYQISKFKNIPPTWKIKNVGSICSLGRGRVINQNEINENQGGYPVYSSQTSNKGEMGKIATFDYDGEWVTWTTDGANAGTVFYRNGKFNCTNVCGTLKPLIANSVSLKFFSYHLNQIAKNYVSYVGNPKLMNDVMSEIALILPPLPQQRKIARILTAIDNLIEKTEALIAKYQFIKQGLMHDLFTRGVDANGKLRPPQAEAPELYKQSQLGWIPKEWDKFQLLNVIPKAEYGISVPLDDSEGIPVMRMNNLAQGKINTEDIKFSKSLEANKTTLKKEDILFNRTNSIEHVGRTSIWNNELPIASFASYLVRLVPDRNFLNPKYLVFWMNLPQTQMAIRKFATIAVHQVNINPTNLRKVSICLPRDLKFQSEVEELVQKNETLLSKEYSYLDKLKLKKTALMQDLLTGKVQVTPDAVDMEPAHE